MRKTKLSILLFLFTTSVSHAAEWSYKGATGPEKWGHLAPENSLCETGKNQSPINIDPKKITDVETRGVKFNYGHLTPETITHTGNLIRVKVGSGANIKVSDGTEFELKYLDFHIPSENTLEGKHFPMEIQFVHQNAAGQQAIVSRMVVPGRPDRTLRKLMANLPFQAGESRPLPDNALRNLEMKKKLGNYYRYSGSLTTPPCAEGVYWFVMKDHLTHSKEQYEAFRAALKEDNYRPVQKLNARLILE